ncbi:MAG TPA: hypothetical protein VHB77_16720 [Planctomycetaceae bacterium]|nr:hypothetical protein [Planctomycetaceae bacterium]
MQLSRILSCGSILLLAVGLTGCGNAHEIKTVRATGTVTYKGEPVGEAILFCIPESPQATNAAPNANAETDSDGHFSLSTYGTGDGAVPGTYLVGITKPIPDPATANSSVPGSINVLPEKYQNPTNSGLKLTVEAGKKNDVKFELTD